MLPFNMSPPIALTPTTKKPRSPHGAPVYQLFLYMPRSPLSRNCLFRLRAGQPERACRGFGMSAKASQLGPACGFGTFGTRQADGSV